MNFMGSGEMGEMGWNDRGKGGLCMEEINCKKRKNTLFKIKK